MGLRLVTMRVEEGQEEVFMLLRIIYKVWAMFLLRVAQVGLIVDVVIMLVVGREEELPFIIILVLILGLARQIFLVVARQLVMLIFLEKLEQCYLLIKIVMLLM